MGCWNLGGRVWAKSDTSRRPRSNIAHSYHFHRFHQIYTGKWRNQRKYKPFLLLFHQICTRNQRKSKQRLHVSQDCVIHTFFICSDKAFKIFYSILKITQNYNLFSYLKYMCTFFLHFWSILLNFINISSLFNLLLRKLTLNMIFVFFVPVGKRFEICISKNASMYIYVCVCVYSIDRSLIAFD